MQDFTEFNDLEIDSNMCIICPLKNKNCRKIDILFFNTEKNDSRNGLLLSLVSPLKQFFEF
jgi:hypothetical protein